MLHLDKCYKTGHYTVTYLTKKFYRMSMFKRLQFLALFSACLFLLTSCASNDKLNIADQSAEDLYAQAHDAFLQKEYLKAVNYFNETERQHPYSVWAERAQLMASYIHYATRRYDKALANLAVYIQLHPGNPKVAYAYYLQALCYYEQISTVDRDQKMTELALQSLNEVVNRFPGSVYAKDAYYKAVLCRDHLAGKEMEVGRFYQGQKQYVAAINRFQKVVDAYQTTVHLPEALFRLCELYLSVGLLDDAKRSGAVLGYNYPDSVWYHEAYTLLEKFGLTTKKN